MPLNPTTEGLSVIQEEMFSLRWRTPLWTDARRQIQSTQVPLYLDILCMSIFLSDQLIWDTSWCLWIGLTYTEYLLIMHWYYNGGKVKCTVFTLGSIIFGYTQNKHRWWNQKGETLYLLITWHKEALNILS